MNPSSSRRIIAIGISISLILAVVFTGIYYFFWKGPMDAAKHGEETMKQAANDGYDLFKLAAKDFYQALEFHPKVTIGEKIEYGPATDLTEIVTAEKHFENTYSYEATWLGSTKHLEIKGDFVAKAGFPIDDSFGLNISPDGKTVTWRHSAAKLISCEMTKLHVMRDDNGWWMKITPAEREAAQNHLIQQARSTAEQSDLMTAATHRIVERLAPLQQKYSIRMNNEEIP